MRGAERAPDAIIVGAGPAGLACAASLGAVGLKAQIIEQADCVGSTWRGHYDRLHLHTDRDHSGLPYLQMPHSYPTYPSRAQVVDYLEAYAARFEIRPIFGVKVERVVRSAGKNWNVIAGPYCFTAPTVVVATGIAGAPHVPTLPGSDLFDGTLLHSSAYRNAVPYAGKHVLVVGFGNSGGEIALDLAEAGVSVALAVRGPVQIIPRRLLGLPILSWAIPFRRLPARLIDAINAPVLRLAVGSFDGLGFIRAAKGPRRMVEEDGRVPLIDIGTLAAIRSGRIAVRGIIDRLTVNGVTFAGGRSERYDAIVLATGYLSDIRTLLPDAGSLLDARGAPRITGGESGVKGLYFCGQTTSPTGQLREIALEAKRIARLAASV